MEREPAPPDEPAPSDGPQPCDDTATEPDATSAGGDAGPDLDAIGTDLADVETALARLEDGTYWTDEVTGDPLPAALLDERPAARRTDP